LAAIRNRPNHSLAMAAAERHLRTAWPACTPGDHAIVVAMVTICSGQCVDLHRWMPRHRCGHGLRRHKAVVMRPTIHTRADSLNMKSLSTLLIRRITGRIDNKRKEPQDWLSCGSGYAYLQTRLTVRCISAHIPDPPIAVGRRCRRHKEATGADMPVA